MDTQLKVNTVTFDTFIYPTYFAYFYTSYNHYIVYCFYNHLFMFKHSLLQTQIPIYPTLFFALLFLTPSVLQAQSGTVFRDFNGNGVKSANEPALAGVIVKSYNAAGVQVGATATSSATGAWSITTGTTAIVRTEFDIPDSSAHVTFLAK